VVRAPRGGGAIYDALEKLKLRYPEVGPEKKKELAAARAEFLREGKAKRTGKRKAKASQPAASASAAAAASLAAPAPPAS
jgi:hypothetical protein